MATVASSSCATLALPRDTWQTVLTGALARGRYKTELSPDFSDVRAKVEQLEKQSQSRQAKAMNYAV